MKMKIYESFQIVEDEIEKNGIDESIEFVKKCLSLLRITQKN